MITHDARRSLSRGNNPVQSPWQATVMLKGWPQAWLPQLGPERGIPHGESMGAGASCWPCLWREGWLAGLRGGTVFLGRTGACSGPRRQVIRGPGPGRSRSGRRWRVAPGDQPGDFVVAVAVLLPARGPGGDAGAADGPWPVIVIVQVSAERGRAVAAVTFTAKSPRQG